MNENREPHFIVVVGASAGGLHSVLELAAQLKPEMDIAVFVILHLTQMSLTDVLISRIQNITPYTCKMAEDGEPIRKHFLYLAQPDVHLLIRRGQVTLGRGPAENRWRPSIDMLFRSAAAAYDSRVIGIILSGLMQDGTVGMAAIRASGGTLIVQDPAEAEFPDMPLSVIQNMEVEYIVPLSKTGAVLAEKTRDAMPPPAPVPQAIAVQAEVADRVATSIESLSRLGSKSDFSCPNCGGVLYEIREGGLPHYKCHVGHSFTEGELLFEMDQSLEATLWVALRMMEERQYLLRKMAAEEVAKGWLHSATLKQQREQEMQMHINRLKDLLFASKVAA